MSLLGMQELDHDPGANNPYGVGDYVAEAPCHDGGGQVLLPLGEVPSPAPGFHAFVNGEEK